MKRRITISILLVVFLGLFMCLRIVPISAKSEPGDSEDNPIKPEKFADVVEALQSDKKVYIKLTKDLKKTAETEYDFKTINVTKDKYLDLNGHTLECHDNSNYSNDYTNYNGSDKNMICVSNDATLYISDSGKNGTIYYNGTMCGTTYGAYYFNCDWYWNKCARDVIKVDGGHLVVYDGIIKTGRNKEQTISSKILAQSVYQQIWGTAVKVVNGGSFIAFGGTYYGNGQTTTGSNNDGYKTAEHAWKAGERDAVIECDKNSRVTVYNGKFIAKGGANCFNVEDGGRIKVAGGTFKTEKVDKIRELDLQYCLSLHKELENYPSYDKQPNFSFNDIVPKQRVGEGSKGHIGIPESALKPDGTFGSDISFVKVYVGGTKKTASQVFDATGEVVIQAEYTKAYVSNEDRRAKLPDTITYAIGTPYKFNLGYPVIFDEYGTMKYGYKLEVYDAETDKGVVVAEDDKSNLDALDLSKIYTGWVHNKQYRLTLYGKETLNGYDNVVNYTSDPIIINGLNPFYFGATNLSTKDINFAKVDEPIDFDLEIIEMDEVKSYFFDLDVTLSYREVGSTEEHVFFAQHFNANSKNIKVDTDYAISKAGYYEIKASLISDAYNFAGTASKSFFVEVKEGVKHNIKVSYVKENEFLNATTNVISYKDNSVVTSAVEYRELALSIKCADLTGVQKIELKANGKTTEIPLSGLFNMPTSDCEIVIYLRSDGPRINYVSNSVLIRNNVASTACDPAGDVYVTSEKFLKYGFNQTHWTDGYNDYDFGQKINISSSITLYPVFESVPYTVTYKNGFKELSFDYDGVAAIFGGKNDSSRVKYSYLMKNGFDRVGYALIGWSTQAEATKVEFELGSFWNKMEDITVYPVYKRVVWHTSISVYSADETYFDIKDKNMFKMPEFDGVSPWEIEVRTDSIDGTKVDNIDLSTSGTESIYYVTIKTKVGEAESIRDGVEICFNDYNQASFEKFEFEYLPEYYDHRSVSFKLTIKTGCQDGAHNWVVTYAHRCIGELEDTYTCSICHAVKKEPSDLTIWHHDIQYFEAVNATCYEEGMDAHYECTLCGKCFNNIDGDYEVNRETLVHYAEHTYSDDFVVYYSDEMNHWILCNECILHNIKTAKPDSVEPHVDTDGDEICDICKRDLHVHTFGGWTYEMPDCLNAGAMYRFCKDCGYEELIELPQEEHNAVFVPYIVGTCDTCDYNEHYVCQDCGSWLELYNGEYLEYDPSYFSVIHKHTFKETYDYDEDKHYNTCIECGLIQVDDTEGMHVPYHEYEYYYDDDTHWNLCQYYDQGCHAHVNVKVHDFGELVVDVPPTCGKAGVGHKECTTCGFVLEDVEILATGNHAKGEELQHDEYTHYYVCSACGQRVEEEEHTFENGFCKVCGQEQPKEDKDANGENGKKKLPPAAAVGIVVGSVVVVGGLGFGGYVLVKKGKIKIKFKKKKDDEDEKKEEEPKPDEQQAE